MAGKGSSGGKGGSAGSSKGSSKGQAAGGSPPYPANKPSKVEGGKSGGPRSNRQPGQQK